MSQQINLFNPVFLKQKRHFSALAMVQAFALVLVGSLGIYAFEARQNRVLQAALSDTEKQLVSRRDQLLRFSKEFSEQGASRALADDLQRAEARLQDRRALLEDLKTGVGGDALGYSRYLGALARQSMQGVWLTGVGIGGKTNDLVIKGRALDSTLVPAYIRALNREPPIAGRRIGELRLTAKDVAPATAAASPAPATAPSAAAEPTRYIEFSLSIPLRQASGEGGKGSS